MGDCSVARRKGSADQTVNGSQLSLVSSMSECQPPPLRAFTRGVDLDERLGIERGCFVNRSRDRARADDRERVGIGATAAAQAVNLALRATAWCAALPPASANDAARKGVSRERGDVPHGGRTGSDGTCRPYAIEAGRLPGQRFGGMPADASRRRWVAAWWSGVAYSSFRPSKLPNALSRATSSRQERHGSVHGVDNPRSTSEDRAFGTT